MLIAHLTINEVNDIVSEHFIKIFGNVVEHYPTAAIGILKNRPFKNATEISEAIDNYLDNLNLQEKEHILKLQVNLKEKLLNLENVFCANPEYVDKVGYHNLNSEQRNQLHEMEKEYKNKFHIPFVFCMTDVSINDVKASLKIRLENAFEQEIETSINEVKKISKYRISQIVKEKTQNL